jgi:AcrR family transcriptional regulator
MSEVRQPVRRRAALPRAQREELILDQAAQLFYARGIRAVGMDELIAALALAKMTVYRLFPTKDALVARYLERLQRQILQTIDRDVDGHRDDPAAAFAAILHAVESDLGRPGFRGCPFGNAAVDFDNPAHPARAIARSYREQLRARLQSLSESLTGRTELGDQIAVLIDGAYLNAAHLGPDGPARAALALARELVAQARPARQR